MATYMVYKTNSFHALITEWLNFPMKQDGVRLKRSVGGEVNCTLGSPMDWRLHYITTYTLFAEWLNASQRSQDGV